MQILRTKKFAKAYKKLSKAKQAKVDTAITLFYQNPHNIKLRNHKLYGNKKDYRAISVGGDIRIIFLEKDNYIQVLMIHVGSHSQVY